LCFVLSHQLRPGFQTQVKSKMNKPKFKMAAIRAR
jgi:hypothetical protein